VWHSGDGLRWQLYEIAPTGLRASDTQPTWFWDPRIRRYVGYSREWVEVAPGRRVRMVGYNESDDMLHWEQFTIAIRADDRDPAPPAPMLRVTGAAETEGEIVKTEAPPAVEGRARFGAPLDFYGPSAVRYAEAEDVYLAMLSAFYHWRAEGEKSWPDTADVQLAVSRDGRSFQRLGGRKPFLRLGPEGSFYSRWLWALPEPIRMGDELWIYYVGSNEDHSSRVDPRAPGLQTAVTRAVLRLDGFVSADADYAGGWLTTPPVVFAGSRLELNLDTSAGGSGRVEVQDAAGRPIPGFSLADADELRGNSVRLPVSWKGSLDVARLAGRPVKLHFKLRDAKLYAFQFVK
jgi:hypothetical protein